MSRVFYNTFYLTLPYILCVFTNIYIYDHQGRKLASISGGTENNILTYIDTPTLFSQVLVK